MGFREGDQLQKQGEGEEGQEIQGHAGWKKKAQKTSLEAALVACFKTCVQDSKLLAATTNEMNSSFQALIK